MQGGLLGVGIENKRNISVISMNGGNMNFEMQAPYESDEESTDVLDTDLASSHERYASRNGSQLKNHDISGAIFTLSLSIRILNSQCVEGGRDVRVL